MEPITVALLALYVATAAAASAAVIVRRHFRRELEVILASASVEPEPVAPTHPFLGEMVVIHAHHVAGVDAKGRPVAGEKVVRGILERADRWYVLTSAQLAHAEGSAVSWEPLPYKWAVEADRAGLQQLDESTTVPAEPAPAGA